MRSLPSPHFKFMQSSQMAVFSCMRLEDVSDSRCRFLGKLIFQAKLFCFGGALRLDLCVCVSVCVLFFFEPSSSSSEFEREGWI